MWYLTALLTCLIAQAYSAPQFITFKEDKLGVNFGGYHASVGIGGGATGGGLFAAAGTPFGQSGKVGLGGSVSTVGRAGGGLYAGATAGGNVNAEAGLGGRVASEGTVGDGFASAGAGRHHAVSGLAGETSFSGSSGLTFSGTKSVHVPTTIIKETEVSVVPVETVKHKKVHTEFNVDALNEINPVAKAIETDVSVQSYVEPTFIVKEVHVQPQTQIVEKHIIHTHTKPHYHAHKTAFVGGYIGGSAGIAPQEETIYKTIQPAYERRVDVGSANVGAKVDAGANIGGQTSFTNQVTITRNPTLFQDIFNIPISALKAVGTLLSNTAGSTSVSVQKSGSIQAESDSISPKHVSSSEAQISVQTPSASQIIDDIFSIPINTLGAVNKFLENNVPVRKRVQVSQGESGEPARVRLGPHARRKANKQVIIVENHENGPQ